MDSVRIIQHSRRKKFFVLSFLLIFLVFTILVCLAVGSSRMSLAECFRALLKESSPAYNRIIWNIRIPRVIAAVVAGAGLSISGLIMQTCLNNPMASPSTLGVSNAAVFGANLSIIVGAGGFLSTGNNLTSYAVGSSLYATSLVAFVFSILSILVILLLCKAKSFAPNVVILSGLAIGAVWTAATTILQFYATDVGLSAAVIWNFGDLGRATYKVDLIMLIVVTLSLIVFMTLRWQFNALLSGDAAAMSMGINVDLLRFISMLLASMVTAVCVSFLGIIGFVGIICPHTVKKILGQDHRISIPASALCGSLLLVLADTLSRSMGNGSALPVGAITSLLGAPFFISIIFSRENAHHA